MAQIALLIVLAIGGVGWLVIGFLDDRAHRARPLPRVAQASPSPVRSWLPLAPARARTHRAERARHRKGAPP